VLDELVIAAVNLDKDSPFMFFLRCIDTQVVDLFTCTRRYSYETYER
jgi:hypothetical protein